MFPYLHILSFKIPLYGVLTALGYLAGIFYCLKRRPDLNITKDDLLDIIFYLFIGALLGGKLFFIAAYWDDFAAASLIDKLRFGFVFIGGFVGAFISGLWILRKKKVPILKGADFFAPAVPLGHAIGKIGCFLAGCCYGKESHVHLLSVKYSNPESLVPQHLHGVGLYPTQLIEAFISFILFFILHKLYKSKHKDGTVISAYILGFGIIRFIAEFFRGEEEIYILGMTPTQLTALLLIIGAAAFLVQRKYARK